MGMFSPTSHTQGAQVMRALHPAPRPALRPLLGFVAVLSAGLTAFQPTAAQSTRAITPADYDQWKSIARPSLTNDGRWAVYTLVPQVGEGWLVARSTSGATEYRFSRGFIGRPTLQTSGRDRYTAPAVAL